MKRSILLSVMALGSALAIVVGAGTFAAFDATDSETGAVTAGDLAIVVNAGGGGDGLTFAPGDTVCPGDMSPGDDCVASAEVTNNGSVHAVVSSTTVVVTSGDPVNCPDGYWQGSTSLADNTQIAPSATIAFNVTVSLLPAAPNGCQNVGATAVVTVNVASIPTP